MDRSHVLVTPAELRRWVASEDPPTLLDVRWQLGRDDGEQQYAAGHVPGAAYVSLGADLADPPGSPVGALGRHPLPEVARLGERLRSLGVRQAHPVVVYDDVAGTSAARAWWLLRWAGHPDVRLLDGGWTAWVRGGGTVETGAATARGGDFRPDPGQLPVIGAVEAAAVAVDGVLLDARAPGRYRGEDEPVDPVAGHVPGAVNVPTSANVVSHGPAVGTFRDEEDLRAAYAPAVAAARAGRPVAAYCGSGVTAAHDVIALELLGVRAALYAGSWSGWASDPRHPVETGDPGRDDVPTTSAHPW